MVKKNESKKASGQQLLESGQFAAVREDLRELKAVFTDKAEQMTKKYQSSEMVEQMSFNWNSTAVDLFAKDLSQVHSHVAVSVRYLRGHKNFIISAEPPDIITEWVVSNLTSRDAIDAVNRAVRHRDEMRALLEKIEDYWPNTQVLQAFLRGYKTGAQSRHEEVNDLRRQLDKANMEVEKLEFRSRRPFPPGLAGPFGHW